MWLLVHGEAPDVSPPIAGAVTPFNTRYGSRVDGETAVTACEYTIDGGATWRPATLTGTMPAFTCATTGIAGHNGQVLRLNMRATSDGGTAQGTALQVTVDTLPPAGTITINGNAAFSRTTTVSRSLTATDASGLAETCISTVPSWAAWEPFVKTKAWTLPSGDGVKTVFAWFRDRVGNTTTTAVLDQMSWTALPRGTPPRSPVPATGSRRGPPTARCRSSGRARPTRAAAFPGTR